MAQHITVDESQVLNGFNTASDSEISQVGTTSESIADTAHAIADIGSNQTAAIHERTIANLCNAVWNTNRNQTTLAIGEVCRYSLYTITYVDCSNRRRSEWVVII